MKMNLNTFFLIYYAIWQDVNMTQNNQEIKYDIHIFKKDLLYLFVLTKDLPLTLDLTTVTPDLRALI